MIKATQKYIAGRILTKLIISYKTFGCNLAHEYHMLRNRAMYHFNPICLERYLP